MVIGNGMIARRFAAYTDDTKHVIFASGVSDSSTTDVAVYNREIELLLKTIQDCPERKLVYFSTCGIYDTALVASPYILHKLKMEELVTAHCKTYCIFRVSNPIGFTGNKHTILNYFVHCIQQGRSFEVWTKAYRNLIDLDDMYQLCHHVLQTFREDAMVINIANPYNYTVPEIVHALEKQLPRKAHYTLIEKQGQPLINVEVTQLLIAELQIDFGSDYLQRLLQKYLPLQPL